MICFRDKTFCSAKCQNIACSRQFLEADRLAARKWWGGPDAPIAFSDFSAECPEYKPAEQSALNREGGNG